MHQKRQIVQQMSGRSSVTVAVLLLAACVFGYATAPGKPAMQVLDGRQTDQLMQQT